MTDQMNSNCPTKQKNFPLYQFSILPNKFIYLEGEDSTFLWNTGTFN